MRFLAISEDEVAVKQRPDSVGRHRVGPIDGELPLAGLLTLALLSLAGATPTAALIGFVGVLVAGSWAAVRGHLDWGVPSWVLIGLAAWTAFQVVPIPLPVLAVVSPAAADVWQRAFGAFASEAGQNPASWAPISVEPGTTAIVACSFVAYAVVAAMARSVERRGGSQALCRVIACVAAVLALCSLGHQLVSARSVFGLYVPSNSDFVGPVLNPNVLAGVLNLGVFATFGVILSSRSGASERGLAAGAALVLIAASVWTASRGGVVSLLIGAVLLAPFACRHRRRTRRAMLAAGLAGVAFLVVGVFSWRRLVQEFSNQSSIKLDVFEAALHVLGDYLWVGTGRGAFAAAVEPYSPAAGRIAFEQSENFVLETLSGWGLLVGAAALALLFWPLRPRRGLGSGSSGSLALLVGSWVWLVHNLADLGTEMPGAVMLWLVSLTGALRAGVDAADNSNPARPVTEPQPRWERGALGLLGVAILLAFVAGPVPARDERQQARQLSAEQLRSAVLRHPGDAYLLRMRALRALEQDSPHTMKWIAAALSRNPNDARSLLLLAQLLRKEGLNGQAQATLRRAASQDPQVSAHIARRSHEWFGATAHRGAPAGLAGAPYLAHLAALNAGVRGLELAQQASQRLQEVGVGELPVRVQRSVQLQLLRSTLASKEEECAQVLSTSCTAFAGELLSRLKALTWSGGDAQELLVLESTWLANSGLGLQALSLLQQQCPRSPRGLRCWLHALKYTPELELEAALALTGVLLASVCSDTRACVVANNEASRRFQARGKPVVALGYAERAAQLDGAPAHWARVAKLARSAGRSAALLRAERTLKRLQGTVSAAGAAPSPDSAHSPDML